MRYVCPEYITLNDEHKEQRLTKRFIQSYVQIVLENGKLQEDGSNVYAYWSVKDGKLFYDGEECLSED